MPFGVKFMNIMAKDREDHSNEVSFRGFLLIAKNRSAHTATEKLVKPV